MKILDKGDTLVNLKSEYGKEYNIKSGDEISLARSDFIHFFVKTIKGKAIQSRVDNLPSFFWKWKH